MVTQEDVIKYTMDKFGCSTSAMHHTNSALDRKIKICKDYFNLTDAETLLILSTWCAPCFIEYSEKWYDVVKEMDKRNIYQLYSIICFSFDFVNDVQYAGWDDIKKAIEKGVVPKYDKIHRN